MGSLGFCVVIMMACWGRGASTSTVYGTSAFSTYQYQSVNLILSVPVPVGPDSHGKYQYGTSTSTHNKSTSTVLVPVQYATSTVLVGAYIPQSEDDYPVRTTIHRGAPTSSGGGRCHCSPPILPPPATDLLGPHLYQQPYQYWYQLY